MSVLGDERVKALGVDFGGARYKTVGHPLDVGRKLRGFPGSSAVLADPSTTDGGGATTHDRNGGKMKRILAGFAAAGLLALVLVPPCAQAQTAAGSAVRDEGPFSYDATKEATINGTVSGVITKPMAGMLWGAHLMVKTSSGTVDASLGRLAIEDKDANVFSAGQHVEVIGVMKTFNDKQVFLTRTVKVGDQVYTIRNENGFPVRDTSHGSDGQQAAQKGVRP